MKLILAKVEMDLVRDFLQISLLILNEFNRIKKLLFPLKSSENYDFLMISEGIEVDLFV